MTDTGKPMHFYTTQRISGRRSMTPEGYLIIEGVPLARTGRMVYGPGEIPIEPGPDGLIHIERTPDQVFRPETIASANVKDIVDNHPDQDVCPDNWNALSHGVILNPRRGAGVEDDFLVGDLVVKSRRGIDLINSGKVELSMGYDAAYMKTGPGRGYQSNIVYNHVALVDKGRCGPRCSIGDRMYLQEKNMPKTSTADRAAPKGILAKARDKLLAAVRSGKTVDEEMLEETLGDDESEAVAEGKQEPTFAIHNHYNHPGDSEMAGKNGRGRDKDDEEEDGIDKKTEDTIRGIVGDAMKDVLKVFDQRLKDIEGNGKDEEEEEEKEKAKDNEKILGALEFEAPPGTNDKELKKTKDSSFLGHSFQETFALAEVLAPGIRRPTFDHAMDTRAGLDTICNLRRTALEHAYTQDAAIRGLVDAMGAQGFRTMDCQAIKPAFVAAAELRKNANRGAGGARTVDSSVFRGTGAAAGGARTTIADVNRKNAEYWAGKDGKKSA